MSKSNQAVTGIAEISLRVHDLEAMRKFYEEVIGLEVLQEIEEEGSKAKAVFYVIGAGDENMALFEETFISWSMIDKLPQIDPRLTTFHHVAFHIALDAIAVEKGRLEGLGVKIVRDRTSAFYFFDPEGKLIEFKTRDEAVP